MIFATLLPGKRKTSYSRRPHNIPRHQWVAKYVLYPAQKSNPGIIAVVQMQVYGGDLILASQIEPISPIPGIDVVDRHSGNRLFHSAHVGTRSLALAGSF
jgi:hypothetical protein